MTVSLLTARSVILVGIASSTDSLFLPHIPRFILVNLLSQPNSVPCLVIDNLSQTQVA